NPGFTQGTTTDPTGWTINSGSMTELRDATDNIETYHQAFDLSQTLPNMPAGVYDVTLQGFARHDDVTVTNKTWLYGGISKEFLISLNDDEEQMRTDPIFCEANIAEYPALGDTFYDNTASNGMYKANGMTGAYYWFRTENPNTGENYYVNHVKVVLDKDGDLKIGIHCEATTDWVIFSNFGIKYSGMDVTIFAQMVEKKKAELQTLYEATDELSIATDVLAEVSTMLEFDAGNIDNADDALAKIAEIDEVIADLKESVAAYTELGKVLEYFENILVKVNATEKFNTLVSDARQNYDSGYATLEAMKADQKAMTDGWSAAVGGNLQAGDDATVAILNPHYDGLVADDGVSGVDFWTSEGAPGYDFLECEFFNKDFNHYQKLTGLTPGYYTLSLDGFYRYGTYNADTDLGTPGAGNAHADGTEELNAVMYVESAAGQNSVALKSIFESQASQKLGVGNEVEADGMTGTFIPDNMEAAATYLEQGWYTNSLDVQVGEDGALTIGVKKSQTMTNDWTIFTNWTLQYLGTEAPDAIEGIQTSKAGVTAIYSIDGRQQNQLRRGINIIRNNGKVQKVLVK
ncbi:MAG: hypothetical protein K6A32_05610, partial [Bacteroidales bacterium]|nr:hypothetical protein [Bacteroidales bacterium]